MITLLASWLVRVSVVCRVRRFPVAQTNIYEVEWPQGCAWGPVKTGAALEVVYGTSKLTQGTTPHSPD